ncbi:MAG: energy-coupling factor transporter ATPase [Clostridiaceae bacterium]|nr:energy-coupling factor transporter ATPase [Clostridiaceae bacterium]
MSEIIKIDNASFEYRSQSGDNRRDSAVNGVSLSIDQGEFIVVLGRNGSGKSTLARLMNALLIPTDGVVYIDGMDTRDEDLTWEIRKTLGLVFQNPDNQIVSTTVEEDVAFGPENLGVPPVQIRDRVDRSLKLVDMQDYTEHSPHMLSGGQKQRVAIAGILAMEPKCIVLDEATSMLDPAGRKEVLSILRRLNKENGITVLHITHHMDEAVYADRVFIMQEGKIVHQGTPESIFDNIEVIREAGLNVPRIAEVAHKLRKKNYIDRIPLTIDHMVPVLKNLLKDKASLHPGAKLNNNGISSEKRSLPEDGEDIIKVRDLSYVYMPGTTFEKKALKNITLNVKKGEILGIIGHTGSGKSTLVQHFNGILKPTSGTIEVDGIDAISKNLKELRRKVGLIFQYPEQQLFEETVYKDIIFGLNRMDLSDEEIKRRVFYVTELLGISPELLEKSPFELSGGQKRRVAIAGVLVMEPEVLVLDEPTAGLDPIGSYEVYKILTELNREKGTTIVLISHSMDDVAEYCDRAAVINHGELMMCDTVQKVFSKTEELKSYGLDIPQITKLFSRLNSEGYNFPLPILTVDDAVDAIEMTIKNSGGDN